MKWSDIRKILQSSSQTELVELIKKLHELSPENKAFLRTHLMPGQGDPEFLAECRQKIIKAIYPPVKFPDYPRFGEARKILRTYTKTTGDLHGSVDLMLIYVETGTRYTNDFGDIDERFYEALVKMLDEALETIQKAPIGRALYDEFHLRFLNLVYETRGIGWGYGDDVSDIAHELEKFFGKK
jgi:hypothetical protein